jgi:uncharacterized protein YbjT (DUF2867 family)
MKKLIICGSTGTQGGAVFDAMKSAEDWELVGFSRNMDNPNIDTLTSQGLVMLKGDLADLTSLTKAFEGADCVFGLTQPWNKAYTKVDTDLELKQGKNIIDACVRSGVKHLVFSSAAHGEDEKTGLPHVDVKIDIETHIRDSSLGYTMLNPVQFMNNIGMKFLPVKKGKIRGFIDGNAKVPYVAVRDIALLAKAAFENTETFNKKEIPLVGDLVSGEEMAAILGTLRNETFRYKDVPRWIIRLVSKEFYKMRLKFEETGRDSEAIAKFQDAINNCQKINPEMLDMEGFLKREGWDKRLL